MKKILFAGAALTIVMVSVPQMVFAYDRANYVVVRTGGYIPTGDLDDANYDTGFTGEVAYGRYLTPNLVIEGGVGYFSSEADNGYSWYYGSYYYADDATMEVAPFTATLKGVAQAGPVDLYVGGGVGAYFASLDVEGDAYGGTFSDDDSDVVLGLHAVAGAVYNINDFMFAGVEAKYLLTDEVDVRVFNQTYEYNLDGFMISGQFGIRF